MDKAGGGLTYRLRVVPPHVNISRPTRATVYIVRGLRANTRYRVYVRAVSLGVYGPEVLTVAITVVSEFWIAKMVERLGVVIYLKFNVIH